MSVVIPLSVVSLKHSLTINITPQNILQSLSTGYCRLIIISSGTLLIEMNMILTDADNAIVTSSCIGVSRSPGKFTSFPVTFNSGINNNTITINYENSQFSVNSSYDSIACNIFCTMFPVTYFASNIIGIDTLTTQNTTPGSICTVQCPLTLSYTGANALNCGQNTVTQLTSISTAVTINSISGTITTVASTLTAGTSATFVVNNSCISSTSVVLVSVSDYSGLTGIPHVKSIGTTNGSFSIKLFNLASVQSLNGAVTISFIVC